ncbi:MAG: hypothetical protein OXG25_06645 [Gammaproteobacteria bacterium]|nr:hypothetical protein [Gammaproteobacteria bacterium]
MQYLRLIRIVVAMLALTSTSLLAQDFLSEFVEVTTRSHVDKELGFDLEYPYEWEPSANPLAESDFYVGAPFAMPSFWITVREIPSDTPKVDAVKSEDPPLYIENPEIKIEFVEFNGHEAMKTVFRWTTTDAGRHFVETTVISFYANDRWYQLTVNQSHRDTRWRPRLQAILDSFRVLESES